MFLKEKIYKNLNEALKKKMELKCSVLRLLNAAIHNKEIEKKTILWKKGESDEEKIAKISELTDEEITAIISSEIKKRKEAIVEFEKGGRKDLVEKEGKEIEILKRYLPEQLSEEEIRKIAREIIKKLKTENIKDLGRVMKELMPKVKGRAEGGQASKIVKELLEK